MTSAVNDLIFMGLRGYQKIPSHDVPHNVGKALAASASRCPRNRSVNPVWTWERASGRWRCRRRRARVDVPVQGGRPDRIGSLFATVLARLLQRRIPGGPNGYLPTCPPLPTCPLPMRPMIRRVPRSRCLGRTRAGPALLPRRVFRPRYPASARAPARRGAARRRRGRADPPQPAEPQGAAATLTWCARATARWWRASPGQCRCASHSRRRSRPS